MTLRPALRLFLPLLLLCGLLPAAAGAAVRPPSDGQLRAAAGKLIAPGSVLTDVSSQADLAQATRKLVVEFRPEDRGGAGAISRATYDPANPLPISGLFLRATRNAGGGLTYDITAVSESQPRFYIRGQKSGGQQVYLQLLSLTLQQLSEDSPEVTAWFDALQLSDRAFPVPPGSVLYPASNSNMIRTVAALSAVYKVYRFCSKVPFLGKKCKGWLRFRAEGVINLAFPGPTADRINAALHSCSVRHLRREWRTATGYNPPPVLLLINRAIRVSTCSS